MKKKLPKLVAAGVAATLLVPVSAYANGNGNGNGFPDVHEASIHAEAIGWLTEQGITLGCGPLRFCPKDPLTREQMASFLQRFAEAGIDAATLDGFTAAQLLAAIGSGPIGPAGP